MPAQSKQQQKLFGLALSVKRGDTPRSEVSDDVLGIVDKMSEKEIEDFASTDHKGLPTKKEEIEEIIRERIREMLNPIMKEGRAFVQAAKKAQQEGKTEFEFNGKTYPITLKEEVITEMSDREFVGDQLISAGEGSLSRNEFIKVVSKKTKLDKNMIGKVHDIYLKLDGRQRVKLDRPKNMDIFLDKLGITESINEVNYIDQTGIKSSVLRNNKVSSLIDFKLWRWAIDKSVKLYKGIGQNYMFTDGIMSLGVNLNKPATIVKKWGKVDSKLKQKYIKDIRENGDNMDRESVNEGMVKIEVRLFKDHNQNRPDKTMPMKIDSKTSLSKLLNHTTFKAIKKKYGYIELHYGGKVLGSTMFVGPQYRNSDMVLGPDNWEFKKGRGLKDTSFRESVNEELLNEIDIKKLEKISKLVKSKDYKKIFTSIENFKKDLKKKGYSRNEINATLFAYFGSGDPKIVQKIKESVNEGKLNEVSFEEIKALWVSYKVIVEWGIPLLIISTTLAALGVAYFVKLVRQGKNAFMAKYREIKGTVDKKEVKKAEELINKVKKKNESVNEATSWNEDEKSAWEYVLSKGRKVAAKSKSKALRQYKNLFNQKLVTWDGFNDSVMLTKNGEDYLKKHGKSLGESVNEASGEFVTFIEKDNGRKKLLRTSKSQRAANMFMRKHMDNLLNKSGIRSIGTMSKNQWEKKEAMYAENIKKSDMKTVTKKEWDRTHKDYKGMIKGQPYMMWFDKKTQSTVYGPVNIKESINERKPSKIVFDNRKLSAAKRINARNWYMKTFPTDELGAEIDKRISLLDVYEKLSKGVDAYKIIGVYDSVVRERIFEKLSKVLGLDYDVIYNMWESVVNEGMVKIEVDLFKNYNQRRPDKTVPMKIDDKTPLSKLLNHTTFKAMKAKYDYIELHYGDKFLGSAMAGTDNWEFKKGNGLRDTSFKESVNEVASRTAMEIGGLTGMNKDAIQKFVDSNELDIEKVFQFVKKGKLKDRTDLVSAIAGKPNNPIQKKMIKMFKESVNEDRQLKDPKKEMMVAKKGKVIVIDKKDWNKYKAKGYIVAENKQAEELWSQTIDMLDKNLKKGYDPSKIRNVNLIASTLQKLFKGLPQRNAMDMATSYNDYKAGQKDKNQTVKDWVRILKKHQIKEASLSLIHKAAKKKSL